MYLPTHININLHMIYSKTYVYNINIINILKHGSLVSKINTYFR